MKDMWSYDKEKRYSKDGVRWHFVHRSFFDEGIPYQDTPDEWYFRNDERTEFGVLRFEKKKDNPHRDYITMINRIMNKKEFRETLLDNSTKKVWNKNWK